jgi:2-polyprenyl-6-methoxyphenol hydroxylase-like FAD-dependent oxidoreductase
MAAKCDERRTAPVELAVSDIICSRMNIIVIGGGICGLGAALLLARDGHDVTVLERDADPLPDSPQAAWDNWTRKGVAQFRQPHNFMPALRLLLEAELPDVQDALGSAGAGRYDLVNPLPPFFRDRSPRPVDDKLWTLTARRPVGEWVFGRVAENDRRVTIRRGVQAAALLTGPSAIAGTPHVAGIQTAGGEELRADLVIDASGRASRSPRWLTAIDARPPFEQQEDSGFTYYTRYFRGTEPVRMGPTLMPAGTVSILTLPGDNGTWSVTLFMMAGDQPLKTLRHAEKWTSAVRAFPLQAHWLNGEPISDVLAMSGIVDRYRRFVVDGSPVVTGFLAVADAWSCTNPSAGRGLTVGFLHARCLRDVLRETAGRPRELAEEFDRRTEAEIAPWYHAQIAVDRARFAEMDALRAGRQPPPPTDDLGKGIRSLFVSMPASPDLFRALMEYVGTITPAQDLLRRPDVSAGIRAAMEAMKDAPPVQIPAPNREQLLELAK